MNKKITAMLCVGFVALVGCSPKPLPCKLVRVNIAFQQWVGYGLLYLAREKGFFKEEGIEPVFIDEQLDSARRDAFKQGMLDFEAGSIDLLVSKAAQGVPVVAVMEIDRSSGGDGIVAVESVNRLEDLSGRRVVLARDDVGENFLSVLFYRRALTLADVALVSERPEKVAKAFLDGKADACVTWEPQLTEALKRPGAHLLTSSRQSPDIVIDTLNVRKDLFEHRPNLVKAFMRVWFKALTCYRLDPDGACRIMAAYYGMAPADYKKQITGLRWDDYQEQRSVVKRRDWFEAFNAAADAKLANKRISQKLDAATAIDNSLLESLYEDRR